jgi:hypothetical protein
MKKLLTIGSLPFITAASVFAQTTGNVNGTAILNMIGLVQTIVARLVPLAIGLAVLAFFWFLIQFIWKGGEEGDARKKSLSGMGWSVFALFVMVSIWGLVQFIGSIFGIGAGGSAPVPGIPVPTN